MVRSNNNKILTLVKEYFLMAVGLMCYALSWTAILIPAKVVGGAVSGIGMLVYYLTGGTDGGIPIAYTFLLINSILVVLAIVVIGPKFGAKTIFGIAFCSLMMYVFQEVIPTDAIVGITDDKLLSAILGGALGATGVAICFLQGGSTGGTDIVAMIVNKYKNISYGRVIMMCDLIIIGSSYFVFGSVSTIIYGYVQMAVFAFTLDSVLSGMKQSSQFFVISKKYSDIADRITKELGRGVTVLDGVGWYTGQHQKLVIVACRKTQIGVINKIIRECDPHAFITIGSVTGVYGQGFEMLRK